MGYWITATPNPAKAGQQVMICYDFENSGQQGTVTLSLTFDGLGTGQSVQVTPQQWCVSIRVPEGCASILIEDMTGNSGDAVVTVVP